MYVELCWLLILLVFWLSLGFVPNWLLVILPWQSILVASRPLWSKLRFLWFLPAAKDGAHLHVQVWCRSKTGQMTHNFPAQSKEPVPPGIHMPGPLRSALPWHQQGLSSPCCCWSLWWQCCRLQSVQVGRCQRWKVVSALYSLQWWEQHNQQAKPHVKRQ